MSGDDIHIHSLPEPEDVAQSPGSDTVRPPPDDLFGALADATRRRVLRYLLDVSSASVHELADVLAGWRLDDQASVEADDHRSIVAALHHNHLPVLDDTGLAVYHREDGTVEATALAAAVEDLVRFAFAYDTALTDQR